MEMSQAYARHLRKNLYFLEGNEDIREEIFLL